MLDTPLSLPQEQAANTNFINAWIPHAHPCVDVITCDVISVFSLDRKLILRLESFLPIDPRYLQRTINRN